MAVLEALVARERAEVQALEAEARLRAALVAMAPAEALDPMLAEQAALVEVPPAATEVARANSLECKTIRHKCGLQLLPHLPSLRVVREVAREPERS